MKKILFTFVLIAMSLGMFSFASADVTPTPVPTPGLVCMQNAVAKRDGVIITAWGKFSTAITTALNVRKNDLVAAWGVNDKKERRRAINASWNAFGKSNKNARAVLKTERNSAWNQFKTDAKGCRINNISVEGENMKNENL